MPRPTPSARRFGYALGLALLLGLAALQWIFARTEGGVTGERAEREAVVTASAVRALVEAADAPEPDAAGSRVGEVLAAAVAADPRRMSAKVVDLAGTSLLASTDPDDGAPRRLASEEKDLYDQAQRLRAAVETNRQEGGARKAVVEVEAAAGGTRVALPFERGGAVAGSVLAVVAPDPEPTVAAWWPAAAAGLLAFAGFFLLAAVAGDRRWVLAILAACLLAAALGATARRGAAAVAAAQETAETAVAARTAEVAATARGVAAGGALDLAGLAPESWDVDRYGRPRAMAAPGGGVDPVRLAEIAGVVGGRLRQAAGWTFAVGLGLLLFVGLGAAGRMRAALARHRTAYFYVVPALLTMLLLVFLPFSYGIALSFTDANPVYGADKTFAEIWVGVSNYVDILSDVHVVKRTAEGTATNYQNFYWTLGFTVVWTIANVAFGVSFGLFLALILNTRGLALRPIYRVLLILPWAVPNYITALIWKGMFHQQFGVINQIVQLFGASPVAWFESPLTAFFAVLSTNGWLSFPFMMVISLGALQSIPAELYEAARVDGATLGQQFRSITLPSLKPALVPAIIISVIWTFNMFNIIYLTSAGGPDHATEILITQAYKIAFQQYRYGYAAAYSTIIFLILLVYGLWQNRVTRATEAIG